MSEIPLIGPVVHLVGFFVPPLRQPFHPMSFLRLPSLCQDCWYNSFVLCDDCLVYFVCVNSFSSLVQVAFKVHLARIISTEAQLIVTVCCLHLRNSLAAAHLLQGSIRYVPQPAHVSAANPGAPLDMLNTSAQLSVCCCLFVSNAATLSSDHSCEDTLKIWRQGLLVAVLEPQLRIPALFTSELSP